MSSTDVIGSNCQFLCKSVLLVAHFVFRSLFFLSVFSKSKKLSYASLATIFILNNSDGVPSSFVLFTLDMVGFIPARRNIKIIWFDRLADAVAITICPLL